VSRTLKQDDRLAHYRILGPLGAGGMGEVYRATDETLERDVALKILPPEVVRSEERLRRFVLEAKSASSLNHPGIVTIYEIGRDRVRSMEDTDPGGIESSELHYIAMELITGATLSTKIHMERTDLRTLLGWLAQAAEGLGKAHAAGIVHRDLKPGNIMISQDGYAKVLDFGLAKRTQEGGAVSPESVSLTQSGLILGTPPYLAPEVLNGGTSDERSDLWALGVLLYEMASGKLPFAGRTIVALAASILHDPVPPLPAEVPPDLAATILRCLAKQPGERYRTAGEVRDALERLRQNSSSSGSLSAARPPRSRRSIALAVTLAVFASAAVFVLARSGRLSRAPAGDEPAPHGAAATPGSRFRSLAVLPLANLSGDANQEFFAEGMTEELISALGPIRALRVISRTSVLRYKGTEKPLREVAQELGVDAIVEGSVRRAGDRVRISARLIDGKNDDEVWSNTYERQVEDVLDLQRDVAIDIAEMIRIEVTPQEHARMTRPTRPVDPKGLASWGTLTPKGVQDGIQLFEQAIAIDPNDPRFYAGIADCYLVMAQLLGTLSPDIAMPRVKEYARKALDLDEQIAEGHASMAVGLFMGDWDWAGAEREARRALELSPSNTGALVIYASILGGEGRAAESIETARLARDRDPSSLIANYVLGEALLSARRFDAALVQSRRTLGIDPTSPLVRAQIVLLQESRGDYPAAIQEIDSWLGSTAEGRALVTALRTAYAAAGPRGYMQVRLERRREVALLTVGRTAPEARLHALLGERDKALDGLEAALAAREGTLLFLNVEPGFESLHGEARYRAVLRRIGLNS
jgi:eukaryotic-like serine/threonine-protein kinase